MGDYSSDRHRWNLHIQETLAIPLIYKRRLGAMRVHKLEEDREADYAGLDKLLIFQNKKRTVSDRYRTAKSWRRAGSPDDITIREKEMPNLPAQWIHYAVANEREDGFILSRIADLQAIRLADRTDPEFRSCYDLRQNPGGNAFIGIPCEILRSRGFMLHEWNNVRIDNGRVLTLESFI